MENIRFVYFNSPVQIQDKNALKLRHMVSHERATIQLEGLFLTIVVDDCKTIIPLHNISSIIVG